MKQTLLLLLLALCISSAKASDTLTIRQVFNFNVGDTFDYKNVHNYVNTNSGCISCGSSQYTVSLYRYLIVGKFFSIDSLTLSYIRLNLYPSSGHLDTIKYQNLDSTIAYYDTLNHNPFSASITTDINGMNLKRDTVNSVYPPEMVTDIYVEGLGETEAYYYANDFFFTISNDSALIYYAKGNFTGGTPYYNQPTGITNTYNINAVSLSPNPSTSTIHLSISELNSTYQFTLTNLLGQEVFSQPVTQTESSINITSLTPGIYLWQLASNGQTIKTGKLVKE